MNTNTKWLIGIGVVILLVGMFALPFIWNAVNPAYGMMGGRGSIMGNGFPPIHGGGMMMPGFGFGLMWLVPLALLTLIGLGIAALIKYLRSA